MKNSLQKIFDALDEYAIARQDYVLVVVQCEYDSGYFTELQQKRLESTQIHLQQVFDNYIDERIQLALSRRG